MRSFLPVRGKARQAGHPAPRAHTSHRCNWRDASEHTRMRLHVCTLRTHSHTHFNAHPLMRTHMFTLMHTVAVHTHRHSGTRVGTHSTDSCTITCSHAHTLTPSDTLTHSFPHACTHVSTLTNLHALTQSHTHAPSHMSSLTRADTFSNMRAHTQASRLEGRA